MKLMFASDIHGSYSCCERLLERLDAEKPEKLVLLGDLLYHGPRNGLPEDYDPKKVISMLNSVKDRLLCVRGNCDSQVDQMCLEFPISSDYLTMWIDGRMFLGTHGHLSLPCLKPSDAVISGHTHIYRAEKENGIFYINCGSVSMPKNDNPKSYAVYKDGIFEIFNMDGKPLLGIKL